MFPCFKETVVGGGVIADAHSTPPSPIRGGRLESPQSLGDPCLLNLLGLESLIGNERFRSTSASQ